MNQELPDLVVGTGGVDSMAGAASCIGVRNNLEEFFGDCGYCLDAPNWVPAGAMQSVAGAARLIYAKRVAA